MPILPAVWRWTRTSAAKGPSSRGPFRDPFFAGRRPAEYGHDDNAKTETTSLLLHHGDGAEHHQESSSKQIIHSQASLTSKFDGFTHSWSALNVCFFHASVYYSIALLGFTWIEKLSILDSLYMATVIFTTIGFGDVVPQSAWGQLFTVCLAGYGIVILGIFLGVAGDHVVETQNNLRAQQQRERNNIVFQAIQQQPDGHNDPEATTSQSQGKTATLRRSLVQEIGHFIVLEGATVALVVGVGILIGLTEGWNVHESVYWSAISGFTIGFGDYAPKTAPGRLTCIFFLPFAVAVLGQLLARIAATYMARKRQTSELQFFQRTLTLADLARLDADNNGSVDKVEFLTYMLVALQKVQQEDIDQILQVFDRLDVDNSGTLTKDDLVLVDESVRSIRNICYDHSTCSDDASLGDFGQAA